MLTGRFSSFATLRQPGGMSGYPSTEESDHDWVENSHASTSLSYAHGLATAFKMKQEKRDDLKRQVVAVIGDGALTGGMAFEGLNNLGHSESDVTIILNDNGRSYAPTISRLGKSLAKIRINPHYLNQQEKIEKVVRSMPLGGQLERAVSAAKAAIRDVWEPPSFFENLGVKYTGPFDGHNIKEVEEAIQNASQIHGPIVVHVMTEKGHGYAPAVTDTVKQMHDTSVSKEGSYTHAFSEILMKAGEEHPNMVAITAAMPDSTGLLEFGERYPERCIDVGIAEQHALTAAAGMAMGGLKPVVAVYSTFLTRAIDQLNLDVGLHRQPIVLCMDRAGITGDDGPSHHGILDMSLCLKVPGMTVLVPSSYQDLQAMFMEAMRIKSGPVSIRWPKTPARHVDESEIGEGLNARQTRPGTGKKVCILSVGKMLDFAEEAAEILSRQKIKPAVWDVRCIKPLDEKMLAAASDYDFVVTVEDGIAVGGAGSHIAAALKSSRTSKTHVENMGVPDTYIPHGKADEILKSLGLDGEGIARRIQKLIKE